MGFRRALTMLGTVMVTGTVVVGGLALAGGPAAGAAPEIVDPRLVERAASAPESPVSAVISFTRPVSLNAAAGIGSAVRLRAFFHSFDGAAADYSGGYVLPSDVTDEQLALLMFQYVEEQRALLETNILEAEANAAEAVGTAEGDAWSAMLADAQARLAAFKVDGLLVHGITVVGRPADIIDISRNPTVRIIRLAATPSDRPLLPWE